MATYYFRNTGSTSWGTASNWSLTDGGGATGSVPTSTDDAIFTNNSGNCNVDTTSRVCKSINFTGGTGYSGVFTFNSGVSLTVSGNVTLSSAMTLSFSGTTQYLTINATSTLTTNGKSIANLGFQNTITVTLADNCTVSNALFFQNASITVTLNSNIIYISGGTITHSNGCTISGTTAFHIIGTVAWTSGSAFISNPITINTSGVFTLSNSFNLNGNTLTYISGTMSVAGSTTKANNSVTITGAGLVLNNLSTTVNSVLTLNNDITINGNLTSTGSTTTWVINGNKLYIGGSINPTVNTTYSGTTEFVMNGTGNLGQAGGSVIKNNLTLNTSGTITFATTVNYNTGVFTYVAGTIITTGSTFFINTNTTLNTFGMTFNIVRLITTSFTLTLNSTLNVSNYIEVTANTTQTFAGTHGFITPIFTVNLSTNRVILNFKESVEYIITQQLNFKGGIYSARHTFQSSHATLKAIITLTNGAYQRTTNVDYTRIDASNGSTLWTVEGTITDSINCKTMETYKSTIGTVN